eukprot:2576737-Amphidinium_carterae.1
MESSSCLMTSQNRWKTQKYGNAMAASPCTIPTNDGGYSVTVQSKVLKTAPDLWGILCAI